ncbi:MAG: hypothetical protein EZS28_006770 [Streblomastix strix]|uniref:Uncharacterized protein n=1 Tax=Streblomastix strix TaxID=222440 RepID=A0A5J4WS08_9EUKA|nr:MAG: hypothetical protein EZS28_006770 [Streblomastix strix]
MHGHIDAAFEGMKGVITRQRHFDWIDPNELMQNYLELDEHIRGVHDPQQGVYRNIAKSDQSLGINACSYELLNDIGSQSLPQLSSHATAPSKGIHKEDDLIQFITNKSNI